MTLDSPITARSEAAEADHAAFAPIRRDVHVACPPERAFAIFTEAIGEWWPMATHSVNGSQARVSMGHGLGAKIVEQGPSDERCEWGTITAWEPGRRLAFSWHPGVPLEQTTEVEVTFSAAAGGTSVVLVHSGWEKRDEPARRRADYDTGWIPVLARFAARAAE